MTGSDTVCQVAVAAPHEAAVEAAVEAAAAGGNAIDAALAAAAVLTVVYPHQCSLGGDLLAVVHEAPGPAVAVLSAGAAPAAIDVQMLGRSQQMPKQGAQTVTVPGVVAGWQALAGLGAALPLRAAIERARAVAATDLVVNEGLARAVAARRDAVLGDDGLSAVFAPGGRPVVAGDLVRQDALAATLAELADDPDGFYRGALAERLVAALRAHGGIHTVADFADHVAEVEPALERDVAGVTWWSAPPPGPGAVLTRLLPVATGPHDPGDLLAACLRASDARDCLLGDPRTGAVDLAGLLDDAGIPGSTVTHANDSGDTAAVTATDADGRTVTLIQSVYQSFGAGLLDRRTGVAFHNRGSAFSTDPASPARVRPGSRPPHTLCPVVAAAPGLVVGLGCQGGRAQPWILAQLAAGAIDPDVDPAQLLERGRWVIGAVELGETELTLVAEPGVEAAVAAGRDLRLPVRVTDGPFDGAGHVQLVRRFVAPGGACFDGASDPRADGSFVVTGS